MHVISVIIFKPVKYLHVIIFKPKVSTFFLSGFSFTYIHESQDSRRWREDEGYPFSSFIPLPPASETLRYQLGNYCRELTSTYRQQLDSNQKLLVSEHKSLTTKLRALKTFKMFTIFFQLPYINKIVNYSSIYQNQKDTASLPKFGRTFKFVTVNEKQ